MQLILLGSGGYHPSDTRHTACVAFPEAGVVFDAGTAMFRLRDHLQSDELDIFLSHSHLDHVVGLTFLLDVLYERPRQRVTIHGRPQDLEGIERHLFSQPLFPVKLEHELRPLAEEIEVGRGGQVRHFPLEHPGGAVGYRVDWEEVSFAYVTDTTARQDAPYVEHIRGVDVLIHECYFPDGFEDLAKKTGHSCLTPVAEVAAAAQVGLLILVHVNPLSDEYGLPDLEAARQIFENVALGVDGMTIEF